MKRILHSVVFAVLLSVGAVASGFTSPNAPVATTVTSAQQRISQADYQYGYYRGNLETQQNKCIDGNSFPQKYESYRQRVMNYLATSTSEEQIDYYQGYLDGMDEGFITPVVCAPWGSGPNGGGTSGGGPHHNGDGPVPTDYPELP